jgi:cytochrome P450
MDSAQVLTTTANLLIAGYLSTTFLIATGTYNLLNTNQVELLRQKPELLMNAINEMLRFDAPAQLVDRYVAKQRVTLGGRELIAGDQVTVVLGSANHDESVFPNAETFDITRTFDPKWPHLGFGWGIHRCIGTPLVQAEPTSKIALEIRRIAQQMSLGVAPIDESKKRRPFWASLLKKQAAQPNFKLQTSMEKV